MWVPFEDYDACDGMDPRCPLAKGTAAVYTLSQIISDSYPTVSLVHLICTLNTFTHHTIFISLIQRSNLR